MLQAKSTNYPVFSCRLFLDAKADSLLSGSCSYVPYQNKRM